MTEKLKFGFGKGKKHGEKRRKRWARPHCLYNESFLYIFICIFFVNITGNRICLNQENAGYQHFLLFPQCFQKTFCAGSLKVGIMW